MKATNASPSISEKDESFWQRHHELLKSSGLSRTNYCQQHDLNYDRFGYWICKWNRNHNEKLVSVKLKLPTDGLEPAVLCVLNLKNGSDLKIYTEKALAIILERYC